MNAAGACFTKMCRGIFMICEFWQEVRHEEFRDIEKS